VFRERIQAKYSELTPSFRKLADFILQDQLDAAFMTATEMAQHLGVDAATVVRFAQTLGYSGFRQLIKEIQRTVKAELLASYSPSLDASEDTALLRNLLENERHNLALAQARVTEQANSILPMLTTAKRIWVTGQGSGAHLAALFASSLRQVGLPAAFVAPDPLEAAANLRNLGEDDVVISYSVSGLELDVANVIEFARQQGAKTLAFSASEVAAAVLVAEIAIVCPGSTRTPITSVTGLTALSTALITAYAVRNPEILETLHNELKENYRAMAKLQARHTANLDTERL